MRKNLIALFFLSFNSLFCFGQELNIRVNISTPKLKLADPKVFKTLEIAITEFLNNTQWTSDQFEDVEKIEGSLQINITEDLSTNSFVADFYIQAVRPIYLSSTTSTLLNHVDRGVPINYEEQNSINNNANGFTDNLSAILSYYAYLILGFDYDSFAPMGGQDHFQVAQNIVSSIPPNVSSGDRGWLSLGNSRNRYWLLENILNPRVRPYRLAL